MKLWTKYLIATGTISLPGWLVGTLRRDVRDGQRSVGPSQSGSSATPALRCVSETAQRAISTPDVVRYKDHHAL
jgi:hypothetical protein